MHNVKRKNINIAPCPTYQNMSLFFEGMGFPTESLGLVQNVIIGLALITTN